VQQKLQQYKSATQQLLKNDLMSVTKKTRLSTNNKVMQKEGIAF
jgi:hypothetical protein